MSDCYDSLLILMCIVSICCECWHLLNEDYLHLLHSASVSTESSDQYMLLFPCAVKRENVIFAVTRHGGHLGYFEGGIMLPNSVTWLDRIVVEFGIALLHCDAPVGRPLQQQYSAICTTPNNDSRVDSKLSSKTVVSTNSVDDDVDDDDDGDNMITAQLKKKKKLKVKASKSSKKSSASSKAKAENKFAAGVVAEIIRVSASMVYDDDTGGSVAKALADDDMVRPVNANHFVM